MSPQFDNQNQEIGIDILLYNIRISYHFCQLSHVAKKLLEKSILVQDPRIEPGSPSLQADSLPSELPGKPPGYTWLPLILL